MSFGGDDRSSQSPTASTQISARDVQDYDPGLIRRRTIFDAALIALAVTALLLSLNPHGGISIKPAFFIPINPAPGITKGGTSPSVVGGSPGIAIATTSFGTLSETAISAAFSSYSNGDIPDWTERPPPPLITDLEGDGHNEIVVATREPRLRLLKYYTPREIDEGKNVRQRQRVGKWKKERKGDKGEEDRRGLKDIGLGTENEYQGEIDASGARPGQMVSVRVADLMTGGAVSKGRNVVALSSGYLRPYDATRRRRQVVIAVLEDWSVLCFDHKLRLKWEQRNVARVGQGEAVVEASIFIGAHPMRREDKGVVVVGGRIAKKPQAVKAEGLYGTHKEGKHGDAVEDRESQSGGADMPETLMNDGTHFDRATHFSFYAFDGRTGKTRWRHEASDFVEEVHGAEVLRPQHEHHRGEMEWIHLRHDIIKSLPHAWTQRTSTQFELAHFSRKREGVSLARLEYKAVERASRWANELGAFAGQGSGPGVARQRANVDESQTAGRSGRRGQQRQQEQQPIRLLPHSESEHVRGANAIVTHLREGIEVVHLYTGQTVTRLKLEPGALHVDLDGDGVIDHIEAVARMPLDGEDDTPGMDSTHHSHPRTRAVGGAVCMIFATSGIPPLHRLFTGNVCPNPSLRSALRSAVTSQSVPASSSSGTDASPQPPSPNSPDANADLYVAPLLALPQPRAPGARQRYDIIAYTNRGVIVSFAHDGARKWVTQTKALWRSSSLTPGFTSSPSSSSSPVEGDTGLGESQSISNEGMKPSLSLYQPIPDSAFSSLPSQTYTPPSPSTAVSSSSSTSLTTKARPFVLAVGAKSLVLLNDQGDILTEAPINGIPLGTVTIADFDNEGCNDVIIVTNLGYYGYTINQVSGLPVLSVMLGALLVCLLGLMGYKLWTRESGIGPMGQWRSQLHKGEHIKLPTFGGAEVPTQRRDGDDDVDHGMASPSRLMLRPVGGDGHMSTSTPMTTATTTTTPSAPTASTASISEPTIRFTGKYGGQSFVIPSHTLASSTTKKSD